MLIFMVSSLAEKTPAYMAALLRTLGNMPEDRFGRYAKGQRQAYESLHLKERPKGAKPLRIWEVPINGKHPDKLARETVERNAFSEHPFFVEPVRRSPIPYGTEPDTLAIEVYPM